MGSTQPLKDELLVLSHMENTSESLVTGAASSDRISSKSDHTFNINGLPSEVIAYVFELYVVKNMGLWKMYKGRLTLGAVCKAWRDIAWTTPALWTTLHFELKEKTTERQVQLAAEWLSRSGSMPLSVSLLNKAGTALREPIVFPLIDIIDQSLHRCRSLHLQDFTSLTFSRFSPIHGPSILHALRISGSISTPLDLGSAGPAILSIGKVPLHLLMLNWTNLTTFNSSWLSVDEIFKVLTLAPQMGECVINIKLTSQPRQRYTPIIHFHLKNLTLSSLLDNTSGNEAAVIFFQNTTFPNLVSCGFMSKIHPTIAFREFLSRSSCPIADLTLGPRISGDELVQIATVLPSIRNLKIFSLTLSHTFYDTLCLDSRYRTAPPTNAVLLPLLQELGIRTESLIPWAWLPGFRHQYRDDGDTQTISLGRPYLRSISIQRLIYDRDYTVPYDYLISGQDGTRNLPNGLIDTWETFSALQELKKYVNLDLQVTCADGSRANLFELSFIKLEQTIEDAFYPTSQS